MHIFIVALYVVHKTQGTAIITSSTTNLPDRVFTRGSAFTETWTSAYKASQYFATSNSGTCPITIKLRYIKTHSTSQEMCGGAATIKQFSNIEVIGEATPAMTV
jgi:hypothetical protein